MYDDPNPPKWPHNGIPFNRWFRKLHDFIYALQHDFSWVKNPVGWKAKYLNIRVDTRNGNFLVFCENPETKEMDLSITPDDLGLEYKPIPFGKMQPMKDAPRDRPILLKSDTKNGAVAPLGYFVGVYKYYEGIPEHLGSKEVFEIDDLNNFDADSPILLGWWELP